MITYKDDTEKCITYDIRFFLNMKDKNILEFITQSMGKIIELKTQYTIVEIVRDRVKKLGYEMSEKHEKFISSNTLLLVVKFTQIKKSKQLI
jgi:hypothetical protein